MCVCVRVCYDFQQTLAPSSDAVFNQTAFTPEKLWYETITVNQSTVRGGQTFLSDWVSVPTFLPIVPQGWKVVENGVFRSKKIPRNQLILTYLTTPKVPLSYQLVRSSCAPLRSCKAPRLPWGFSGKVEDVEVTMMFPPFSVYIGKKAQQKKTKKIQIKHLDVFVFAI